MSRIKMPNDKIDSNNNDDKSQRRMRMYIDDFDKKTYKRKRYLRNLKFSFSF